MTSSEYDRLCEIDEKVNAYLADSGPELTDSEFMEGVSLVLRLLLGECVD